MQATLEPLQSSPTKSSTMLPLEEKKDVNFEVTKVPSDLASSSQSSTLEKRDEDPAVPNGGTLAWLQVLGSFFLWFNTWFVKSYDYFTSCIRHYLQGSHQRVWRLSNILRDCSSPRLLSIDYRMDRICPVVSHAACRCPDWTALRCGTFPYTDHSRIVPDLCRHDADQHIPFLLADYVISGNLYRFGYGLPFCSFTGRPECIFQRQENLYCHGLSCCW